MAAITKMANSTYPTKKVAAAGVAGAVSIVVVWVLHRFVQVDVPPEVASAGTTILAFLAGYFMPPASREN
jgi:hypothetical protein